MSRIDENLVASAYSDDGESAAVSNLVAMSLLSSGHINLSIAKHFQIPAVDSFVVVAAAFWPNRDAAPTGQPTVVPDAWLTDMRRCLAAECGFPIPALLGPTNGTMLVPASSVLGRRMSDLYPSAWKSWSAIEFAPAWILSVASRVCAEWVASVQETPLGDARDRSGLRAADFDIDAWVATQHYQKQLMQSFSVSQQRVLSWHLQGFGSPHIAEQLKIDTATVCSHLQKVRETFRAHRNELERR